MTKRTVLITGASSGFGKLTVTELLTRGYRVLAGLRGGEARLREVFAPELRQYAGALEAVDLHLDRPETFAAAAEWIERRGDGGLDVLVNNAGYGLFGALEDLRPEQLRRQMEVNFIGPALLTRALLPYLRARRGRVINVSSIAGLYTFPMYGSYAASKHALEALTEGLWYELRPHGVQVALVEPGGFRTDFAARSRDVAEGARGGKSPYAARIARLERAFTEHGARLGDPRRVARLIARIAGKPRIRLRWIIGADARFMAFLGWILPDRVRVRVVEWFFRKAVFSD